MKRVSAATIGLSLLFGVAATVPAFPKAHDQGLTNPGRDIGHASDSAGLVDNTINKDLENNPQFDRNQGARGGNFGGFVSSSPELRRRDGSAPPAGNPRDPK